MYKNVPLLYKSNSYPASVIAKIEIDTGNWKIGFSHYYNYCSQSNDYSISLLCISLVWRKFDADKGGKKECK